MPTYEKLNCGCHPAQSLMPACKLLKQMHRHNATGIAWLVLIRPGRACAVAQRQEGKLLALDRPYCCRIISRRVALICG